MSAHYDLQTFKTVCGSTGRHKDIELLGNVLKDAQAHYNLNQKADVLYAISDALDGFQFSNSAPWKNNPAPNVTIIVDSYNCHFREDKSKHVYLAFMYMNTKNKWAIKSFHPSTVAIPAPNNAIAKALIGANKGGS